MIQRRPRLKAAVSLLRGRTVIALDYPVRPRARYGFGLPAHPRLHGIIAAHLAEYKNLLRTFSARRHELEEMPQELWHNSFLPALDAAALYLLTASLAPPRYVEIGSGASTRFVRAAVDRYHLPTTITSIDPLPRHDIDALCHTVIRQPLEESDLTLFQQLSAGDMLFADNSHHCFPNSDVTVFFLDILPNLPAGVLVGIHDILLPDDYPPSVASKYYNEQYLLAAYLLGGAQNATLVLPCWFANSNPALAPLVRELFFSAYFSSVDTHGSAFWFRTT